MPGGDGTGPMGSGPMTGRAAGFCSGYAVPGSMNAGGGRGFYGRSRGRGGGGRWGQGRGFGAGRFGSLPMGAGGYPAYGPVAPVTPAPEQELNALKQQATYFQDALEDIQKRIEALGMQAPSK
jgi:uncharacterized protein DUF5320